MANLLAKFRIDYSDVIVIPDVAKKAAESSRMEFDQLIEDFKAKSNVEIDKENEGIRLSIQVLKYGNKVVNLVTTIEHLTTTFFQ